MLEFFQQHFSFRGVVFSQSPSVIVFCRDHHLTCITSYAYRYQLAVTRRGNQYNMPLIRFMLMQSQRLFRSQYYGYVNSDILLSTSLFTALSRCASLQKAGVLKERVTKCRVV